MKFLRNCAVLAVILAALCLLLVPAQAAEIVASGECGAEGSNVTWTLDADGLLTISGTGAMVDYTYESVRWNDLTESIKQVVIQPGVTTIGDYAFAYCGAIVSVSIPEGITSIGQWVFYNCRQLTDVDLPSGVTSFGTGSFGDTGIISFEIPKGVTIIPGSMFDGCEALTSVAIPEGVTTIKEGAFSGCTNLQSLTLPDSLTSISPFSNPVMQCGITSIYIGKGLTQIPYTIFNYCGNLQSIWVSEENPSYSSDAYGVLFNKDKTVLIQAAPALSGTYTVPEGVVTVDGQAFFRNHQLECVILADSVRTLGPWSLGYTNIKQVILNEGLTTIQEGAFRYADNLESIVIPGTVQNIEGYIFQGSRGLKSVTLCEGMTYIGNEMFGECKALTEVIIPDSVTTIGQYAFSDCTSLRSIELSDNVTSIGSKAFYSCTNLNNLILPGGITFFGDYVFNNCRSLTDLYFKGTETQWEKLMASGTNNSLRNTTIHYNYVPVETAITAQPENVVAKQGQSAQFQVDATGYGLTYQWQYSLNGGKSWFNSTAATQGYNTDTLTVMGAQNRDGFLYRCRITDSKGEKLYSEAATLTVDTSAMPRFTAQPASQAVTAGGKTVFTAAFTGEYSRVYWQYSIDGGKSWYASSFAGCETDALTVEAKDFRDGFLYRCVLIDAYGNRIESAPATLTVK